MRALAASVPPSYHGRALVNGAVRYATELAPVPASVPAARNQARDCLAIWGYPQADDAVLVVSELATNAIQATAPLRRPRPVHLALSISREWLLVAVADASPLAPVLRDQGPDAISGRGLAVVEAMSARWGWHRVSYPGVTKTVWAEFTPTKTPNVSLANAVSREGGEAIGGM